MGVRRIALPAVLAAAVLVAGCGSSDGTHRLAGSTAHHPTTARPTLTGSLRLARSIVRSGERVDAELVLHNSSGRTRILDRGCPHGFMQLTLSKVPRGSGNATSGGLWALPACSFATFVAHPGTTRYRLGIAADYGACLMPDGKSLTPMVHCLQPGNRAPPLPAGRYRVALAAVDKKLRRELAGVRPIYVRIVG